MAVICTWHSVFWASYCVTGIPYIRDQSVNPTEDKRSRQEDNIKVVEMSTCLKRHNMKLAIYVGRVVMWNVSVYTIKIYSYCYTLVLFLFWEFSSLPNLCIWMCWQNPHASVTITIAQKNFLVCSELWNILNTTVYKIRNCRPNI